MSVNRFNGEIIMECDSDNCTESLMKFADEFDELIREAKDSGWKSVRENGEWANYCPACQ